MATPVIICINHVNARGIVQEHVELDASLDLSLKEVSDIRKRSFFKTDDDKYVINFKDSSGELMRLNLIDLSRHLKEIEPKWGIEVYSGRHVYGNSGKRYQRQL